MRKIAQFFRNLAERIFNRTKDIVSDSTGSSLCGTFLSGYYTYLGIMATIITGNPVVFMVWAFPAVASLIIILTESYTCSVV